MSPWGGEASKALGMKTGKLKYRIALPVTGVVALLLIANICLSFALQEGQMKETLREQAYILSEQMQATWDFVAVNQYKICLLYTSRCV